MDDLFDLYDLRIEVSRCDGEMVCSHTIGDHFEVRGENISMPSGQGFSLYALAALLPLIPAKQRDTAPNDWMTTDAEVRCPDPHCGAIFTFTRIGRTTFRHSDVSAVPLR